MYIITIDCGTTNTRVFLTDREGRVRNKVTRHAGVRNTSMSGSSAFLEGVIKEMIQELLCQAGVSEDEIEVVLASGMITSEIGLKEIPHLEAPVRVKDLADTMEKVEDLGLTQSGIPVYFVRGIKNPADIAGKGAFESVGQLDFMRGEETQVAGLLMKEDISLPLNVVVLSSHTKYISVDKEGRITESLTTASGQVRYAILENTFVGKSVTEKEGAPCPLDYFDEDIVDAAVRAVENTGLLRAMMFPRFLDVLLDTAWYERKLYYEALIAADDMMVLNSLKRADTAVWKNFFLTGVRERCRLYEYLLKKRFPEARIQSLCGKEEIDELSIRGILSIWEKR